MTDAGSIKDMTRIAHAFAGGEQAFRERPFLSLMQCPVVAPLNLAVETCDIIEAGVREGMPVHAVMFGQGGATSPAALAGNVAQTTAEVLGTLIMCNMFAGKADHPVIVGNWQGVCDLRTGSLAVGSGEMALTNAAGAQVINYLGLPSAISGGVSDSKLVDAQRGAEVALTNVLTALAGANMVSECLGNMGTYMAMSYEGFLCDNDIIGACQRVLRGIEVNDETLSFDVIEDAITGSGHYLDKDQSLNLMQSEYCYPDLADRNSFQNWKQLGSKDIAERAHDRVFEILSAHFPRNIDKNVDERIRQEFQIDLNPDQMQERTCRWATEAPGATPKCLKPWAKNKEQEL